jgi:hypothetical protein
MPCTPPNMLKNLKWRDTFSPVLLWFFIMLWSQQNWSSDTSGLIQMRVNHVRSHLHDSFNPSEHSGDVPPALTLKKMSVPHGECVHMFHKVIVFLNNNLLISVMKTTCYYTELNFKFQMKFTVNNN